MIWGNAVVGVEGLGDFAKTEVSYELVPYGLGGFVEWGVIGGVVWVLGEVEVTCDERVDVGGEM